MWILIVVACGFGAGAGCSIYNQVPIFETEQMCNVAEKAMQPENIKTEVKVDGKWETE